MPYAYAYALLVPRGLETEAPAQLAADGKNEQDMDREMRVQEMEDAINRAMDARRAAQRSGEFKSTGMLTIRVVIIVFVIFMG